MEYKTLCTILFSAVSIPIIWFLALVEVANKPLDEVETKIYRRKARTFLLIETIIVITLPFIGFGETALVGATSLLVLATMLILGS